MSLLRIGLPLVGSILLFALTAQSGQLTLTVFVAVNVAFAQTLAVGLQVGGLLQTWARVRVLWQRMEPLFQTETDIRADAAVSDDLLLQGAIALENVWLTYRTSPCPVLRDVSLRIEPDEFVAIVGTFGSGKTSLLRLLMGFENPDFAKAVYLWLSCLDCQYAGSELA
jgi:ABC-type bacteriocin/lantibiotic exporter with double-glycine peptidase domain